MFSSHSIKTRNSDSWFELSLIQIDPVRREPLKVYDNKGNSERAVRPNDFPNCKAKTLNNPKTC
jgi:hypothetical protein